MPEHIFDQPPHHQASRRENRVSLPQRTRVYTLPIWVLVFVPLAFPGLTNFLQFGASGPFLPGTIELDPLFAVPVLLRISLLVFVMGMSVVLAFQDWRSLKRLGVHRPFHWAWAFLGPYVYVIGRSVIVREVAPKKGLAPVWTIIGVWVLSSAASLFLFVSSPAVQTLLDSVGHESAQAGRPTASPSAAETSTASPTPTPKEFTDQLNDFAVTFPREPQTLRDNVPAWGQEGATVQRDIYQTDDSTSIQYVTVHPMSCTIDLEDHEWALQSTLEDFAGREASTRNTTSSIHSQKIMQLNSFPTIRATIIFTGPGGTTSTAAALIVFRGATLVTVMASGHVLTENEKFVDSFRFLDHTPLEGPSCRELLGVPDKQ